MVRSLFVTMAVLLLVPAATAAAGTVGIGVAA